MERHDEIFSFSNVEPEISPARARSGSSMASIEKRAIRNTARKRHRLHAFLLTSKTPAGLGDPAPYFRTQAIRNIASARTELAVLAACRGDRGGLGDDADFGGLLVQGQWSIKGCDRGTLMRHEVDDGTVHDIAATGDPGDLALALSLSARTRSVSDAPGKATLVALGGIAPRLAARRAGADSAAIPLAAIAAAAQQHLRMATRTHEQAGRMVGQARLSSGEAPPRAPKLRRVALDEDVRQCNTGAASAASARCRAWRSVLKLPGDQGRRRARL